MKCKIECQNAWQIVSDRMPDQMPDRFQIVSIPDRMSDQVLDRMQDQMPERIWDKMSEYMS